MAYGLVATATNTDIEAQQREEAEARNPVRQVEDNLLAHLKRRWEVAKRHKQPIEKRLLNNLRQRNGEYDPGKLQAISEQGGTAIYMNLTAVKCRAAKSWIRDVLMPAGDRPWTLRPRDNPELPPEAESQVHREVIREAQEFLMMGGEITPQLFEQVMEQVREEVRQGIQDKAERRADQMAEVIEEQLDHGGWSSEFDAFLSDVVDFPAGIIKGPVLRWQRELSWRTEDGLGVTPEVTEEIAEEVERVSPWDFYPLPGVIHPNDGDCFQRHRLHASDLYELIGLDGYREDKIRAVLREIEGGYTQRDWATQALDSARARANDESGVTTWEDDRYEALEFWGTIKGRLLKQWGYRGEVDEERQYHVNCWWIGRHVIYVEVNPDPLGRKPYGKASFEEIPDTFWGRGVPDLISDCQDVCNAAARALVNNMAIASGPQVAIDTESVPPGEDVRQIFPWKIWQLEFDRSNATARIPIHFYQPNPLTEQLMSVYQEYSRLADEHSGIPAYTHGTNPEESGAMGTASGLSMLMNAASKAIKNVIRHIDVGGIEPIIRNFYVHNMLFHPDEELKGDVRVVARGALSLIAKEQVQMRRQEFLAMTNNPTDQRIMGIEGRAALLRELVQTLDMNSDEVIPDKDELRRMMAQEMMQQQQAAEQQAMVRSREAGPDGQPMGGEAVQGMA